MDTYSVVFLLNNDSSKIVLLQRAPFQSFAPNRWTGIGGKMEPGESFEQGALRELEEETGIKINDINSFREVADISYKDGPFWPGGYRIIYYEALYDKEMLPNCNEGRLEWISVEALDKLDIINDTKSVLILLIEQVFGRQIAKPLSGNFIDSGRGVTDRVVLAK